MSPVDLPCPRCRQAVSVPEEHLGRGVTCPHCGTQFNTLRENTGVPPDRSDSLVSSRPRVGARVILATGLVVAGCVALVFILNRPRHARPSPARPAQPASPTLPAQRPRPSAQPAPTAEEKADTPSAGQLTGSKGSAFLVLEGLGLAVAVFYLGGLILTLGWVARDARGRNVDGGVWVLVVLLLQLLGLLVYLLGRPRGALTPCTTCSNKRLVSSKTCPHCGNP